MRLVFFIIMLIMSLSTVGQDTSCRFVFYNVENLFDTIDSPDTRDEEFLPQGDRHWNGWKYSQKLKRIYKTLVAVKQWETLSFIGLCEIENKTVVSNLLYKTPLYREGYRILHQDSPDERGVDVALLYREEDFTLLHHEFIRVSFPFDSADHTRDILYAKGLVFNSDTIHIYLNHWPSRYGGYMKTKPKRNYTAKLLAEHISNHVLINNPEAHILIAGDFNDDPSDESLQTLLQKTTDIPLKLMVPPDKGTTKFRSQWYLFDQVYASESLINNPSGLNVSNASIAKLPFLIQEDERYGGQKLFRSFLGPKYIGGYSDHLPVYIDLFLQKGEKHE